MLVPTDDLWDKDNPRRPKVDECPNCARVIASIQSKSLENELRFAAAFVKIRGNEAMATQLLDHAWRLRNLRYPEGNQNE